MTAVRSIGRAVTMTARRLEDIGRESIADAAHTVLNRRLDSCRMNHFTFEVPAGEVPIAETGVRHRV